MAVERGRFVVIRRKNKPPLIQVQIGDKPPFNVPAGEISHSLMQQLDEFNGKEVEFERVSGQPKKVREVGGTFLPSAGAGRSAASGGQTRHLTPGSRPSNRSQEQVSPRSGSQGEHYFHNPYNFIPAPPRNVNDSELGDHRPVGQDSFDLERYTGQIRVRMTTKTPILVPDTENVRESNNGHKIYPLRVGSDGKPLIPASSVRGMLRSAYEAVTNSRFGRFSETHRRRLQYRESRRPFRKVDFGASAWDLLHESLRPAATIKELSPADRVFGWVKVDTDTDQHDNSEPVAARGLLRLGPVTCESSLEEAVESFPDLGVPLAILSTPKPQQSRFYVGKSNAGEAQDGGLPKGEAGYSTEKGLRGRKVYPHQASLPQQHWDNPTQDRTQEGRGNPAHYQEYRRPQKNGEERDDQNRSILGWVKTEAEFTFDLRVHNLSKVELGALLWLLNLPKDHFFRLGSGKPLGFGSVRLMIEVCDVRKGDELRQRYEAWHTEASPSDPSDEAVQAFKSAIVRAYPPSPSNNFANIAFIQAFLTACRGYADAFPIHYPRATSDGQPGPPSADGESFKWFVANERAGARYTLPDLANDAGLPALEDSSDRRRQPEQRGTQPGRNRPGRA